MVKGISRQVILVHAPDPALFEQAIFILKEDAVGEGISEDALLKEAQRVIHGTSYSGRMRRQFVFGTVCLLLGAGITSGIWLLVTLI